MSACMSLVYLFVYPTIFLSYQQFIRSYQSVHLYFCPFNHKLTCPSVCLHVCPSVYLPLRPMSIFVYLYSSHSVCMSLFLSICLSLCLSDHKRICLSICLSIHSSFCQFHHILTSPFVCLHVCPSAYFSLCPMPICFYLYLFHSVCLPAGPFVYLFVYPASLSITSSVYLYICLPFPLSLSSVNMSSNRYCHLSSKSVPRPYF